MWVLRLRVNASWNSVLEHIKRLLCIHRNSKKERDFLSHITVRSLLKEATPDSGREINMRVAYPTHSTEQYVPQLVKQFSTFTKPTTSMSKTYPGHIRHTFNNHLNTMVIFTMPWSVLRLRMEGGLKISRVVWSTLNKQSWTTDKGQSSSLGTG
jgi:hypothetical protein